MTNHIPAPVPGYRYSQDGDPVHAWWEPARPYPFRPCLDLAGPGKCRRAGGRVITDHPENISGMLTAWPEDAHAAGLFGEGEVWVIRFGLKAPWLAVKLDTREQAEIVRGLHAEGLAFHADNIPPGSFTEKGSGAGGTLPPRPTRPSRLKSPPPTTAAGQEKVSEWALPGHMFVHESARSSVVGFEALREHIEAIAAAYDDSFPGKSIPPQRVPPVRHEVPRITSSGLPSVPMNESRLAWAKGIGVSAEPVNDPALTVDEQWGEEFEL